uniref:Uncharacterized protein n=1 Tax=Fusarium oxysporum (strain Fo5176) TaxID=660025 RepID=A0A0D2XSL1_FUSOF
MSMQEADLIIALGGHFDDRVTGNTGQFAPGAKPAVLEDRGGIVHFEIMPTNISRVVRATQAVEGDVATNLQLLIPLAEERSMSDRKEWFHQINEWKRKWPLNDYERAGESGRMKSQEMVEQLSNLIQGRKANTLITNGVGQHQNLFYEDRYSYTHHKNPDFIKFADSMGVPYRRVSKPEEVTDNLK